MVCIFLWLLPPSVSIYSLVIWVFPAPPKRPSFEFNMIFLSTLVLDKRYRIERLDSVDIWLKNQVLLGMEQRRREKWKEHT